MSELLKILMDRDGLSKAEAMEQIKEARAVLHEYLAEGDEEAAYEVCAEMFGLEPDFLMDLL